MICKPCGTQDHSNCKNVGTDTDTWCDCQHKVLTLEILKNAAEKIRDKNPVYSPDFMPNFLPYIIDSQTKGKLGIIGLDE